MGQLSSAVVVVVWHFRPGATWRNVSDTSLPLSKSGLLLVLDLQWHKFCNYFKNSCKTCKMLSVPFLHRCGRMNHRAFATATENKPFS